MKQNTFVTNYDLISANQSLNDQIKYLQRELQKMDEQNLDLKQCLKLNKQAINYLNSNGPNNQVIKTILNENRFLKDKIENREKECSKINAMILIQKQLRNDDQSFYEQRVIEFENRINDLRKYLHDKQQSFSVVIDKLKKYEEVSERTMADKLNQYHSQIGGNISSHQVYEKLVQDNIYYRKMYHQMKDQVLQTNVIVIALRNKMNYFRLNEHFKQDKILSDGDDKGMIDLKKKEQPIKKKKKVKKQDKDPNKELIRLLKKEKINNEILDDALNQAIEKNQQLMSNNEQILAHNTSLKKTITRLKTENMLLYEQMEHFDNHYGGKYQLCKTKSQYDWRGHLKKPKQQQKVQKHEHLLHMHEEVERMMKIQFDVSRSPLMIKSSSQPRLLINIQSQDDLSQMQIDEY